MQIENIVYLVEKEFFFVVKRERNINLLFHLFMHSLGDSYTWCPEQESNPQLCCIRMMY